MYVLCVGQKWVAPSDFWSLPPGELWWLVDAMMPKGSSAEQNSEMYDMLMAAKAAEGEVRNG